MEFTNYVRKPFTVEAVEVTVENIEALAEIVGTLRSKEDGTPYIQVNRRLVPNVFRVYQGFWVTRMGDNIHCYSPKVFKEQFTPETYEIQAWVDWMNDKETQKEFSQPAMDEAKLEVSGPEAVEVILAPTE